MSENTTPEAVEETTAAPAEETKEAVKKEVAVPKEFTAIIDAVEKMSVLELNALVKVIEEKWGVSASAVAAAGPAAGGAEAEKSTFDVVLVSDGGAKIPVMKVVKDLMGLGLKEAKDLVESAPATLKEGAKADEANDIKAKIEEAGGKVELK